MARQSYLKNAAILTGTGLLLRAAGMFFRIYIAARIGAEGMGLYQLIYTVYTMAVTLATAGLSVAATRLSAELLATDDPANVRAAMRRTLALGLGLGAAAAALLFTGAGLAADWWLEDARAALSLRILAPSLPFMAVSACLRGFFMARRKVGPNSRAQIFEQVVRIGVVALLIDSAVPQGIGTACAAVVVGNTVSEAASWVYMEWCYRRELRDVPRNAKRPVQGLGRQLWDIIAPIAANQYMTSVLRTVENVMVPGCLAAVYAQPRNSAQPVRRAERHGHAGDFFSVFISGHAFYAVAAGDHRGACAEQARRRWNIWSTVSCSSRWCFRFWPAACSPSLQRRSAWCCTRARRSVFICRYWGR